MHKKMAAHHAAKTAFHATAAEHFKKLAGHLGKSETTEAGKDSKQILETLAGMHEEQSQEHAGMATFHHESMEACAKAADGDLNKLVPTSVSGVTPTLPNNIRAVPRAGMREIPSTAVPDNISKILGTDEADWHVAERSLG